VSEAADAPPARARRAPAPLVAAAVAGLLLVTILAVVATRRAADPCHGWERQLGDLSGTLTLHRLAQGDARHGAVAALEELPLPCAKVATVRDDCAAAYRALLVAEARQAEAKAAVRRLERSVDGLGEPVREVARRRYLLSHDASRIGRDLGLDEGAVAGHLAAAVEALGPERLALADAEIDTALSRSEAQLRIAATRNARCDAALKALVERAQSR
jgi:DNA-directed RNA polymerase specialized sigma24 family protein